MPRISVVIPAYNAESTIQKTVESVQSQTFSDIEIIVINDGSTDRTLDLLENISDSRLKIFSYENAGVCAARNRGIFHATGEFISFVDADDWWTPDKLEAQFNALKSHPEAGVAYSWTFFFYEHAGNKVPGHPAFFEGDVYAALLQENFLASGSNVLARRIAIEQVGEFDSTFPHCADWDYYLRLAAHCKFALVQKHQIIYRQSTTSMTSTKIDGVEKQCLSMLNKAYQSAPAKYQHLKNHSFCWIYQYCTQQYLQYSTDLAGIQTAGQKFWQAVQLHPQILLEGYGQSLMRGLSKRWLLLILNGRL
jgi:glycosyltransferase involved in cell wall biosynthesis